MFRTDNTKLQSELLELGGKLIECEKSIVGYTQEASQLDSMLKASAEKEKEYQLQLSTLSAEKAALESNLEAASDLIRKLENELETLRTSNLEEKLNQANLEVLSLKRDIEQMQRRVETGSGSLNLALDTIYTRDEGRELNRSFEDAIAEVQSLCKEISTRSNKKVIESGTCMDDPKIETPDNDSFLVSVEKHNLRVATIIKDEGQSPWRTDVNPVPIETAFGSLEDTSTTLVAGTPPPVLQPSLDSLTTEPQPPVSTKKAMESRDALIELEECIPATQTPIAKAQRKRRLTKAIPHPETTSKTLQMLLGQSPSPTVNKPDEKHFIGGPSSISDGNRTPATSDASPVAGKKRVRYENHDAHIKGPEPVSNTPTPSRLMIPPAQPMAKRPRYERPAALKHVITKQQVIEAEKSEKIAGSASRTVTEKNGPKPSLAMPEPQYSRAPSPSAAGPKRKRAPTKRG
ncbi:hypothetical protein EV426DRAFT_582750 [Tirmania nivea]|nr:hypothetical protein EV426DRAFT_582750 [Tirmania nivea]